MHLQDDDSLLAAKGLTTALQFLCKVVDNVARNHQTIRRMQAEGALRTGGDDPVTGRAAGKWRRELHGQLEVENGKKQTFKVLTGVLPSHHYCSA